MTSSLCVAGVDGCPAGWIVVFRNGNGHKYHHVCLARSFAEILNAPESPSVIAVDMPIGLPDRVDGPGRPAEQAVRPLLGLRQSSVFSIPSRAAVMEKDYRAACSKSLESSVPPKKISRQSFNIFPKIREIDALMVPALQDRVYEVHPEVAFWRLNGENAMSLPKKIKGRPNPDGIEERKALLREHAYDPSFLDQHVPRGASIDDFIDACVCAVIAERIALGEAQPFPAEPHYDSRGLRVAIWA